MSEVLIVGSVAYDGLKTPYGSTPRTLGGAATYSSLASSLYAKTHIVGVVGEDFHKKDLALLKAKKIGLDGLARAKGKTFFWKGFYKKEDMNIAYTLKTDLNVFATFDPKIPEKDRKIPFLFLANIHPALQYRVTQQMKRPKFILLDTMNLWINIARKELLKVMGKVDLMVLNDQEVKLLTGEAHLKQAARAILKMGPKRVIVKKGEHGAMLIGPEGTFLAPAMPLDRVVDPTGAGDTFAGGFIGYLARQGKVTLDSLKRSIVVGSLTASFTVQELGVKGVAGLSLAKVRARAKEFYRFASLPPVKL
ncbi:MAG TPA: PfkB family carbohydrate kinase [bacterium]|nr:PfkB family carbohydrate kinase [bacterium]